MANNWKHPNLNPTLASIPSKNKIEHTLHDNKDLNVESTGNSNGPSTNIGPATFQSTLLAANGFASYGTLNPYPHKPLYSTSASSSSSSLHLNNSTYTNTFNQNTFPNTTSITNSIGYSIPNINSTSCTNPLTYTLNANGYLQPYPASIGNKNSSLDSTITLNKNSDGGCESDVDMSGLPIDYLKQVKDVKQYICMHLCLLCICYVFVCIA
jgi:hypothetical protein